jgi:hypothetical protein
MIQDKTRSKKSRDNVLLTFCDVKLHDDLFIPRQSALARILRFN